MTNPAWMDVTPHVQATALEAVRQDAAVQARVLVALRVVQVAHRVVRLLVEAIVLVIVIRGVPQHVDLPAIQAVQLHAAADALEDVHQPALEGALLVVLLDAPPVPERVQLDVHPVRENAPLLVLLVVAEVVLALVQQYAITLVAILVRVLVVAAAKQHVTGDATFLVNT